MGSGFVEQQARRARVLIGDRTVIAPLRAEVVESRGGYYSVGKMNVFGVREVWHTPVDVKKAMRERRARLR